MCIANASWNPELRCSEVQGTVHYGIDGATCEFSGNSNSVNNPSVGFLALVVGLKVVAKFVDELAPKALRIWIITDSKYALQQIWGNPRTETKPDPLAEETKKIMDLNG